MNMWLAWLFAIVALAFYAKNLESDKVQCFRPWLSNESDSTSASFLAVVEVEEMIGLSHFLLL